MVIGILIYSVFAGIIPRRLTPLFGEDVLLSDVNLLELLFRFAKGRKLSKSTITVFQEKLKNLKMMVMG